MKTTTRLVHADVLKGLAIIGIVLQHCGFSLLTANLHVPVFFIISGYFFKEEAMGVVVKKRTRQLLIPYLWFVLLFFLVKWVFNYLEAHDVLISLKITISSVKLFKLNVILHKSIWFLPVLFFITVLYRLVRYVKNEWLILGMVLLLFLVGYLQDNYWHLRLIYLTGSVLSGLIYFHFGYMFRMHEAVIANVSWSWMVIIIAIWCGLTLIMEPEHSYKNNVCPIYLPLLVTPSIIALFLLLKKLCEVKVAKPLVLVGLFSMGILGYHALCNIVIDELEIVAMVGANSLPYFRLTVIILFVPIMIYISNQLIPWAIGKEIKCKKKK